VSGRGGASRATPATKTADTLRLFVALWPEESLQEALLAESARFAALGRRLPARNLHVTLAFLGAVPRERVDDIAEAMRTAEPPACALVIDRLGYFKASRILWAGASEVPEALMQYQRRLCKRLRSARLHSEERAFKLHVSLLRDATRPAPEQMQTGLRLDWSVKDVALVASAQTAEGSRYRVLTRVAASG
jgi:2'-5' RNA ligase